MTLEMLLIWIVVGAIAGWLAAAVVGRGYGLVGDIIVGICGAFIGGWVFQAARWHMPVAGLAGTIIVAFIGAVLLLLVLRLIAMARARG